MALNATRPDQKTPLAGVSPSELNTQNGREDIPLLEWLAVIGEHKQSVFVFTAAVAILTIIVSLLLPKSYTATVTLLPPQPNTSIGVALTSQLGSLGGMAALAGNSLGLKNPNDAFIGMLKTRTVEDGMVQEFNLKGEYHKALESDARMAFERHVVLNGSGKDGLIHIDVQDRSPDRAAELANGYVVQFRKLSEHLAITEAGQRRLFFEQQLAAAKDNLADAEEALKRTEQTTGVIELSGQARALIESGAALRAQITAKEVQIEGMKTYATGQNSQLIEAESELDGLQAQLAKLGGMGGNGGNTLIAPKGVPEAGLEYVRKLRDVKYYETIFDILARQYEVAKLDEAKEGSLVQVVDAAVPPDKRSFPKRTLMVLIATIVGFIIAVAMVLIRAAVAHMKDDPGTMVAMIRVRDAFRFHRRSAY